MGDAVESEAKLDAGVGFVLPALDGVLDGVSAAELPEERLSAVYLDAPDLRLMRSGVTLRHRQERSDGSERSEWTLKLPLPSRGPVLSRREISWPGDADEVPAQAAALVRGRMRGATPVPVARLVTARTRTALAGPEGIGLAEVDDDVVSVMDGPHLAARFREIEVELADDAPAGLAAAVIRTLEESGAHPSAGAPKVVRALGARALAPPDGVAPDLRPRSSMAEVVSAAVAGAFTRIVDHDAGIRLDDDPEHVHQARVATRRLRSDLRSLAGGLDPAWVHSVRDDLGWLAGALGAVRDADVLAARLRASAAKLPPADAAAAGALLEVLAAQRAESFGRLVGVLDSPRYAELLERLVAAVAAPPLAAPVAGGEAGGEPGAGHPWGGGDEAREVLPGVVARAWRHLAASAGALGGDPGPAELHRVRIGAKRLRYSAETAAPVCGRRARATARAATDLQTVLGELNDAAVAQAWLRQVALGATPAEALAAGRLLHAAAGEEDAARREWRGVWKRLKRKKLRSWLAG